MRQRPRFRWLLLLLPPLLMGLAYWEREAQRAPGGWREASRAPVGLAPDPATTREAVIQVYAARAVRWRGYFGVHTWIAAKKRDAPAYTVYEVTGWRLRRAGTAVSVGNRPPDARWFGNAPELLAEQRGPGVEDLIARVEAAVAAYPYAARYSVWPGPNSNTFTAYVLRAVPELRTDLPATAIGKDYLAPPFAAAAPSGTGGQFNLYGAFGIMAAVEEGLEINVLGLTFGIDPKSLDIKLPLAGRLGFSPRGFAPAAEAAGRPAD